MVSLNSFFFFLSKQTIWIFLSVLIESPPPPREVSKSTKVNNVCPPCTFLPLSCSFVGNGSQKISRYPAPIRLSFFRQGINRLIHPHLPPPPGILKQKSLGIESQKSYDAALTAWGWDSFCLCSAFLCLKALATDVTKVIPKRFQLFSGKKSIIYANQAKSRCIWVCARPALADASDSRILSIPR